MIIGSWLTVWHSRKGSHETLPAAALSSRRQVLLRGVRQLSRLVLRSQPRNDRETYRDEVLVIKLDFDQVSQFEIDASEERIRRPLRRASRTDPLDVVENQMRPPFGVPDDGDRQTEVAALTVVGSSGRSSFGCHKCLLLVRQHLAVKLRTAVRGRPSASRALWGPFVTESYS